MALSITQTPATISLAQSPIMFAVSESNGALITSQSFQYVGELYYWTGTPFQSGSADYTIVKYPNSSNVGLFDLNRIINSTLTDLAQANSSNVVYFAVDSYTRYLNTSNVFVTGSHVKSDTYKGLDGYQIFPESVGAAVNTLTSYWPIMTDGPVSQSVLSDDKGQMSVYVGTGRGTQPTIIRYTSDTGVTADFSLTTTTSTSGQINRFPIGPAEAGFPLGTTGLEWYKVQARHSGGALGSPIHFDVVCNQKYPNVRIKWKNRFGQFDYLDFNLVNRQGFETTKRTYQPQLGTWESSTFSYNSYDSAVLNYINDSVQTISVNSNYIQEAYNDVLKQLLVSDEIYWQYDNTDYNKVRPLTIQTSNIVFKTGVVDKLIQYQFEFKFGQPYKLIM